MAKISLSIRTDQDFKIDFEKDIDWNFIADKVFEISGKSEFSNQEVVLSFCDEVEIQYLNKNFRDKDYITDVLSFNAAPLDIDLGDLDEDDEFENQALGDIVICAHRAKEQAETIGHSLKRELIFLFIHGLLHLLGYDHERSQEDEKIMFDLQDRILTVAASQLPQDDI